jgi:sugar-specific transcriptional regulator TrmB
MPRTSAYTALAKLMERGLVDFYVRKRRKLYVPAAPERFVSDFELKRKEAQHLVPALRALMRKGEQAPQITLHEGIEGIRSVFAHILEARQHFSAITSLEDFEAVAGRPFKRFISRRIESHLRVRLLTNDTPEARRFAAGDAKALRETRVVLTDVIFHTANYIFGHHIALLSIRHKNPLAVLIHDEDIALTQQIYFDLLWIQAQRL